MSVTQAFRAANSAHTGQTRKGSGEPYINHPIEVLTILLDNGITDKAVLAAALLHDVVEDTPASFFDVREKFGFEIAGLVEELTTPPMEGNRESRKVRELTRLSQISGRAQTVKYADIIANTRDIVETNPDFAPVYLMEKRAQLMVMADGHVSLRNTAWLQVKGLLDERR